MDLPELWTALLSGQYDLANQMIDSGANVNEPTKTKINLVTSLLHYAVFTKSDIQCIHALANLGANFNARDSWKQTPLHWAAKHNASPDVVEVLINNGAVVDARDNFQWTPLHYAARKENKIELVHKLIARGASIDAVDATGTSVLHFAILCQYLQMVKMLISHGVNIDPKDKFGYTPLHRYLSWVNKGKDKTEIVRLLLDNGADVNTKSRCTAFPLYSAAKFNHLPSLRLLLTRGARVNEATNMGEIALHMACREGLADVAALLLEFGADLNARNVMGKTPCEYLRYRPSGEVTAQIIIKEAVKREALGQSPYKGYKAMAESCETYSRFDEECREEIKRMQTEKIDAEDSVISFFHILSMDEEKLAALARNEKIVTAFESSSYVASFGIYAGELTTKFEAAKKRANFLTSVEDFLCNALGDILPAPIVQKIAVHVKYGDIIENEL